MAYYGLENFEKASELYERALDAWTEQLGWEHTNTLMTCNGLAGVYFSSKVRVPRRDNKERSDELGLTRAGYQHLSSNSLVASLHFPYFHSTQEYERSIEMYDLVVKGFKKWRHYGSILISPQQDFRSPEYDREVARVAIANGEAIYELQINLWMMN